MKAPYDLKHATEISRKLSSRLATLGSLRRIVTEQRVHVVNPSLCHDALQRLAPSLKPHHGCDLIDVNPGACLWSRHLHDTLQPRRHILVEPDRKHYDEFITPLINEHPDRYHHVETLAEALDPSRGLLSEDVLNNQLTSPLTTQNPSLLISANTSGHSKTSRGFQGLSAAYFLNDYYQSLTPGIRSDLHRYGLVRMLAWIPDSFKSQVVPRTMTERSRQSILFEACASISEIASTGWSQSPVPSKRDTIWPDLASEAANAVHITESAAGVHTPKGRKPSAPLPLPCTVPPVPKLFQKLPGAESLAYLQELTRLDSQLKVEFPEWHADITRRVQTSKPLPWSSTPDQKVFRTLLTDRRLDYQRFQKVKEVVKAQVDLEQRWREYCLQTAEPIPAETSTQLQQESKTIKDTISQLPAAFINMANAAIDEYRAFKCNPRALAWNHRNFEPLMVQPKEFYPKRALSLVDFTPLPRFRQVLSTEAQVLLFDKLVGALTRNTLKSNIHRALNEVLGGGVDEFIETCPSLKDQSQGGYFDLADLRLRSLPIQTFFDLTLAYEIWPFRSETELMFSSTKLADFN